VRRSLEGKRALVTGAGSGIGRAIAVAFTADGARVAGADIDADGLAQTAKAIRPAGGELAEIACDVSEEAAIVAAFREVEARLGGLDILVSNAGNRYAIQAIRCG
jgi:3-oxoacyl-[acyl-carrier protein] reductase